jgi:hypothetical protein
MPNLLPTDIRLWLRERDWDYQRLADECNGLQGLDRDDWTAGGVRNAVNGYDPVRAGRINRIALVTQANPSPSFPKGITYELLVDAGKGDKKKDEDDSGPNRVTGDHASAGAA